MIDWNTIDTVFLDMDGTLLDLHFDNYFWREYVPQVFAEANNLDFESAKNQLFPLFQKAEGTMEWYCVDYWSQELNLDIEKLKRDIKHLIQVHPFAIDFLVKLKSSSHRVVLLTNAHQKSLLLKMEITQLENHFDRMISTHEIGVPKENNTFWDKLQLLEQFDKNKTLLVDDSLSVLNSARDYGIKHIVAITAPDSKSEAKKIEDYIAIENFSEIMPV